MIRVGMGILLLLAFALPCHAATSDEPGKSTFHVLDYLAMLVYLVTLVWIGFHFSKKNQSTNDYFLAGRRIPWWAATLSIFSTHLSAITFMGIPAKAFSHDWVTILVNLGIILVAPVTVFLFLPLFRRLNVTTVYEYLERRFSPGVRVYGSIAFVTYQNAKMSIFLLLPAIALATVTGFNIYVCIGVMGVLCIIYTVLGGIEAVIWTDVIQSVILIGGGLLCFGMIFAKEDFALGAMLETANANNKFHIFNLDGGLTSMSFWVVIIGGFFIQLVPFTSDQALAQRFLTTPTEKAAARSVWAHAAMVVPASLLFFGLGTGLFIFYNSRPELLPDASMNDKIVPWFIVTQLPAGLAGLVIAGIFAATMSSVDSGMHSIATTLVNDVYSKVRPKADDAARLKIARILTVIIGLLGMVSAMCVTSLNPSSLWDLTLLVVGLFGSSLAGVFLLGTLTKRANARGVIVGVIASIITLTTIRLMPAEDRPVGGILTAAVGCMTCVIVGYLASLLFPAPKQSLENLTFHTLVPEKNSA